MAKLIEKIAATEITQFPPASVLMQRAQNAMPVNPNPMSMGTAAVPMAPGTEEAQQGTSEGQGAGEVKKKSGGSSGSNKIQIEVVAGGGAKSKPTSKATSKAATKPKAKAKKK